MYVIHRAFRVLKSIGLGGLWFKSRAVLADWWFDLRYGLDTGGIIPTSELTTVGKSGIGHRYEGSRSLVQRHLFSLIQPLLPPDPVLVDIGSGKGRLLLIASEFPFQAIRGVEFAQELCAIAAANVAKWKRIRQITVPIETICSDALEYLFQPDENVIYLFNPFPADMLAVVLGNLSESLEKSPRQVLVCFLNIPEATMLADRFGFSVVIDTRYWGYQLVVGSNQQGVRKKIDR